jgi:hypothetical protein
VIVTFYPDDLALHQKGIQHAGIAGSPEQKYTTGHPAKTLLLLHGVLNLDAMRNLVERL